VSSRDHIFSRAAVAAIAAAMLLLAACGSSGKSASTTGSQSTGITSGSGTTYQPVTIKFADPGNQGVLAWAKKNHTFDAPLAAVNAKIEWVPGAAAFSANLDAMKAGNINASGGAVSPYLGGLSNGLDFQIFSFADPAPGDKTEGIVATKASGIKTVQDLVGKKVAVNAKAHGEWLLLEALKEAGIDPSKVTRVPIQPPDAAAAFASGQIQAWATFLNFFSGAVAQGATVVAYEGDFKNNDDVSVVGASKEVLTKNTAAFDAFEKVYAQLTKDGNADPQKYVNVIQTSGPQALSGPALQAQVDSIRTAGIPREPTPADVARANRVVQLFVDNGVLPKSFDVNSVVFDVQKALKNP
jgi:sulfonate transport system substrate-binding protein